MQNPEDISDPTIVIDMTLALMAKVFTLKNTTLINNNQRSLSNHSNMQITQPGMNMGQDKQMQVVRGNGVKSKKQDDAYLQQQLQIAQEEEAGIQSTQEEFNFMAVVDDSAEKQQSLYNGKVLLEKRDPPVVYDSEETLELAQESRLKIKQLNKEIKTVFPKVDKTNALSKPVTSDSAPSSRESIVVNNESVIALEIFRINLFKAFRVFETPEAEFMYLSASCLLSTSRDGL
nr:hypothetical protein [Tanacetum cinerariifolium]